MSRKRGALLSEQTELQASLQQAQTELREQEVAIATREGEFNALQNSNRLLHQKIETVVYEIQSLAAQEQEGSQKRNALAAQLSELEARERAGQEQVAALTTRTGKPAPAARRRQRRADRKQGGARGGGAALRVVPPAATGAGAAHPRVDPGHRTAPRRVFVVRHAQGAGGIGDSGFAQRRSSGCSMTANR